LQLAVSAAPLRAQQERCLERTFAVNVLTDSGEMVQGLTARNFLGKLHGEKIETTSAVLDTGPRRIVIVLDASGDKHDTWALKVLLARRLVEADETSSIALVTFAAWYYLSGHPDKLAVAVTTAVSVLIIALTRPA